MSPVIRQAAALWMRKPRGHFWTFLVHVLSVLKLHYSGPPPPKDGVGEISLAEWGCCVTNT